jgi:hypothetical protein
MWKRAWECLFLPHALQQWTSACHFKPCARATRHCFLGPLFVCTGLKWPTDSSLGGHGKKRHPHAQRMVSFIYNPGAKRRGHLLKS